MFDTVPNNVIIDRHRIAWGRHGDGEPLVLLHGTPAHSFIWRDVVPQLVKAGRCVYLFDMLGYGASERPLPADTSVAAQEALLVKLLDRWGLDKAAIIGHDIGGAVALRLAVHTPARMSSMMLVDSVSYDSWPSSTWRQIIEMTTDRSAPLTAEEFQGLMTRQLLMTVHDKERMSGAVLNAYLRPITGEIGQPAFFRHQVAHYDSRYTQEVMPFITNLKIPVGLIWGEEDAWQPLHWGRRLAVDLDAELSVIPKAGHFAMEDAPTAVADAILTFLNKQKRDGQ